MNEEKINQLIVWHLFLLIKILYSSYMNEKNLYYENFTP